MRHRRGQNRIPVGKSLIWQYLVVGETPQKIVSGSRPHLAVLYTRRLASAGRSVQWPNGIESGFVAALLISALAVSSPAMASNIVLNPGFETDALAPWVANPSSSFPWVMTGPSGFGHTGQFYASTQCVGAQCMSPDPDPDGAWLYQDLVTTPGATYDLSFWYTPDGGPNSSLRTTSRCCGMAFRCSIF